MQPMAGGRRRPGASLDAGTRAKKRCRRRASGRTTPRRLFAARLARERTAARPRRPEQFGCCTWPRCWSRRPTRTGWTSRSIGRRDARRREAASSARRCSRTCWTYALEAGHAAGGHGGGADPGARSGTAESCSTGEPAGARWFGPRAHRRPPAAVGGRRGDPPARAGQAVSPARATCREALAFFAGTGGARRALVAGPSTARVATVGRLPGRRWDTRSTRRSPAGS